MTHSHSHDPQLSPPSLHPQPHLTAPVPGSLAPSSPGAGGEIPAFVEELEPGIVSGIQDDLKHRTPRPPGTGLRTLRGTLSFLEPAHVPSGG